MSGFTVQRVAEGMKFLKLSQRIGDAQQRSIAVVASALEQYGRRDIQIDDPARVVQPLPVLRIDYDAATGGDDGFGLGGQFPDRLRFTTTKSFLALDLKDRRNGNSGALHDFMV